MEDKAQNTTPAAPLHPINPTSSGSLFSMKFIAVILVITILGIGAGYMLRKGSGGGNMSGSTSATTNGSANGSISSGTMLGTDDTSTFKDTAEGVLKNGGIEGEGQFHLVRPGGDSQSVYMTSSTVDLSKLIDRKIKVWGQTQKAAHAGWLMDVGRVQVE